MAKPTVYDEAYGNRWTASKMMGRAARPCAKTRLELSSALLAANADDALRRELTYRIDNSWFWPPSLQRNRDDWTSCSAGTPPSLYYIVQRPGC